MIPTIISAIHTIELIGSYTARHVESGVTVDVRGRRNRPTTKGPIAPLCRKLVEMGFCPTDKVHIIRKALDRDGNIPVFKRDRSLRAWADADCIETETRSVHLVKHRPFPDAVKARNSRNGPETSKGTGETIAPISSTQRTSNELEACDV